MSRRFVVWHQVNIKPSVHMQRLARVLHCAGIIPYEHRLFAYAKTKTQISFAVTAKLISAFVFATRIVQSLNFLNLKFQASSHLLCVYSPVCVGPGRKPLRPVFSQRGSYGSEFEQQRTVLIRKLFCCFDIHRWHIVGFSWRSSFLFLLKIGPEKRKKINLSHMSCVKKPVCGVTRPDTNEAVQPHKMARGLKFLS